VLQLGHPQRVIVQAGERRLAPVESLRALAALGVLLFHVELLTFALNRTGSTSRLDHVAVSGSHGVYLFFSLSGYLIFRPFAQRAWGAGTPVNLRRYARNRVLRILPLYYVAVVLLLLTQEHGGTATQWLRFPLFLENYWPDTNQTVDGPLWSIVVELQFYLVLPLLAWAVARRDRRWGGLALLDLFLIGYAGREIGVLHHVGTLGVWKTTFVLTFVWFVPGMLLAWLETCCAGGMPAWVPAPLTAATLWFAAGVAIWLVQPLWGAPDDVYLAANVLLVGSCVLPLRRGVSTAVLSWRPLAALGVASYSLYVWHAPILLKLDDWHVVRTGFWPYALAATPLCIAAAALSYWVVERPFLRQRRRWSAASPAPLPPASEPVPPEVRGLSLSR
jgi:peptidoglycan/LPS O-acetylase OafA/YrhL